MTVFDILNLYSFLEMLNQTRIVINLCRLRISLTREAEDRHQTKIDARQEQLRRRFSHVVTKHSDSFSQLELNGIDPAAAKSSMELIRPGPIDTPLLGEVPDEMRAHFASPVSLG